MRKSWPLLGVALLGLCLSCSTSFKQVVPSYVPYNESRPIQVYPRLTGESCEWKLFALFPISGSNQVNAAVASMTRGSTKIDNLFGFQVEEKTRNYLVVSSRCTLVSGYPVIYKDTDVKWQLFEPNMMTGKLVKKPPVSRGGAATKTSTTTTRKTGKSYKPRAKTGRPARTTSPTTGSSGPTKKQCETKCARFATLWKGSDAIRSTIRAQCIKKCLKPGNDKYRQCIERASKIDDIAKCNSM